jgi:hypothetical protein
VLTNRQRRFVGGQVAWTLITATILSIFGALSLTLSYVISFIGFLVLMELTAPSYIRLRWRARLKWFVLLGLVGLVWIQGTRILNSLSISSF